jgi:predicted esterase
MPAAWRHAFDPRGEEMNRSIEAIPRTAVLMGLALCSQALWAQPSRPADPRAEIRSYVFEDTGEEIPYALYVSSKVSPDKKSPLVIALHGLGGSHTSLVRGNAIDLAEEGGYILVGPMGYNSRGWYGIPADARAEGAYDLPPRQPRPRPANAPPPPQDPSNLRELSEKDVLEVLAMVREEFNVDEDRTYLMGHSMGGAGTFYLGVKHPETWAAIAAIAPAAFMLHPSSIATTPEIPVFIIHGALDTAVPVEVARAWVDAMQDSGMTYEYRELGAGDHGNVITLGMPDMFAFFEEHSR